MKIIFTREDGSTEVVHRLDGDEELTIEASTKFIPVNERTPVNRRVEGLGVRVIPLSLPRIRFLEKSPPTF